MLKFKVESLDEVEEKYRDLYEKKTVKGKDGKTPEDWYFLKVEGAIAPEVLATEKKKVADFRMNNTKLAKRLTQVVETIGVEHEEGIENLTDDDLVEKITEKLKEKGGEGGAKSAEEIAKLVDAKVGTFRSQMDAQVKKLTKERDEALAGATSAQKNFERVSLETNVLGEASKRGLKPTAHADIMNRARGVFKMVDGKLVAYDSDGETQLYGADGATGLTIEEWIESQASKDAIHLFEGNSGGGAPGGSGGAGRNGVQRGPNPWKKESFNVTRQMEQIRKDPVAARRLAEEANVKPTW